MKNAKLIPYIKIASVVFTAVVLGLSWSGYFSSGNRSLKIALLLLIGISISVLSFIYNPESRKAYTVYGLVALVFLVFWFFAR
ncbi:MAG: hypothetical protein ACK57D_09920 [Sphingobacteriales bacterium]|jgi:hypothetical protein